MGEAVDDGQDLLIGKVPCYGLYPTSDGHLAVGALEPKFWAALCSALERPDLLDCGYDTGDAGEATREVLSTIFQSRSTAAWTAFFADVDACVEPVLAPDALLEALATIVVPLPALPAPADDTPARFVPLGLGIAGHRPRTEAAPALGAHNHLLLP